jgi:hypothetical protein
MAFDFSNVNFLAGDDGTKFNFFQEIEIRKYLYDAY